jgi:hypothetical protein
MFRSATTTAAITALALGLPAGATAAPVDASIHAEAHAVVDSANALQMARAGADRAKALVQRSEAEMHKAYEDSKSQGLEASAKFGAAAHEQSAKLAALVRTSHGSLRAAAAKALSQTGRWEATLVAKTADRLDEQQSSASAQQGDTVATIGDDQASITTTIVVTASDEGLRDSLRSGLDKATAYALLAQADLAQAVERLKQRSEDEGQQSMADAQSSLHEDGQKVADAVQSSGRADVSFTVDGGSVRMDDLAVGTVDPSNSPVQASATGEAHVSVNGGGRR